MTEKIEEIIKTAKSNKYNTMDMMIAAQNMMKEELKNELTKNGGIIVFPKIGSEYHPYMVACGTDVFEVKVKQIYLDGKGDIKVDGETIDGDYIGTFDIDEFLIGQLYNVLSLIN